MIEASGISFSFGAATVLAGVSLGVRPGELLAIVGPNGAGKSTLLHLLTGVLRPAVGSVELDGRALGSLGARELARRRAVLPQASPLVFNFTVREVVEMGRLPHEASGMRFRRGDAAAGTDPVAAAMERMEVAGLAGRSYPALSGGEQQRVQLARCLAQVWPGACGRGGEGSERYLFLDEPTNNLDIAHQHACLAEARQLAAGAGLGVCCVLHDLNLALAYADRCVLLAGGRVYAQGPAPEVLTPGNVAAVFGVRAQALDAAGRRVLVIRPAREPD